MKSISIDIETFSSVPLAKAGVYKYAASEDFEVLLFGYAETGVCQEFCVNHFSVGRLQV